MNYSIEPFGGSLAFFEVLAGAELVVSIEEQCDAANDQGSQSGFVGVPKGRPPWTASITS